MPVYQTGAKLSATLKHLRERSKMGVNELGAQIGSSGSLISYFEHGDKTPSLGMLARILDVFDYELVIRRKPKGGA